MGVTRGWLPQKTQSPIPVGGGDAATVPPGLVMRERYISYSNYIQSMITNTFKELAFGSKQ